MDREVYQGSGGGSTYVPLEQGARIIGKATPRLARTVSWKYSMMPAAKVREDLRMHHGLRLSNRLIQSISSRVGDIMWEKRDKWRYRAPVDPSIVAAVGVSRDGTTTPIRGEGYKESMAGTVTLYGESGRRLHTTYVGCAPEHGRKAFEAVLGREVEQARHAYGNATFVGIADGDVCNWNFLGTRVEHKAVDYWHAAEYLAGYAGEAFRGEEQRREWLSRSRERLRDEEGGAVSLLAEMGEHAREHFPEKIPKGMGRTLTYFGNYWEQMDYYSLAGQNLPIGSGVVEAACKTLVKQRLSLSGCQWHRKGAQDVLMARSLALTEGRWEQFWNKLDRYGA